MATRKLDAGLHPEFHYEQRLSPVRARIRSWLLPIIRREKEILVFIQSSLRHPFLDWYFPITSNLGTHTFYMVCLPLLFWFGYAPLGRGLTLVVASGVFWTGFVKDMLCLPRPLSPPINRMTMSGTHHLEYGFPSTHTANAISITLYLLAFVTQINDIDPNTRKFCIVALIVYCSSVVLGRIYCGMHSITGGTIMGAFLWWFQWNWQSDIDAFILSDSWFVPMAILSATVLLIYIFPEPVDNCPCFEDCVAFAGVIMGLLPGCWRYARSKYSLPGIDRANVPYDYQIIGLPKSLGRLVIGVAILFIWRMVMKKILYMTLPPFYRALNLNIYRKDYLPAKDYKNLSPYSIRAFPSVLNLLQAPIHSTGPQSTADLYEQLDAEKENERGLIARRRVNGSFAHDNHNLDQHDNKNNSEKVNLGNNNIKNGNVRESSIIDNNDSDEENKNDENFEDNKHKNEKKNIVSFDAIEEPPLRYDVDVVVKLVVYAGIGWLAVDLIPVFFELSGLGVNIVARNQIVERYADLDRRTLRPLIPQDREVSQDYPDREVSQDYPVHFFNSILREVNFVDYT
ncbi:12933_t:CDS:10 [Ambispora gerdemannii]|uniref:12933_t:CDS:1 n=1 Tax=Ambispora gerdemannii TaxID=144530 RepID=A0A9N8W8V4_9GLOM|nr:12933_t:CDS:10 [Ambispora gerdemannii]